MFSRQVARGVTRLRIQCTRCDDIIEFSGDYGDFVYCSCQKVGLGGGPDSPTIHGDEGDYRDVSQVKNFQVR